MIPKKIQKKFEEYCEKKGITGKEKKEAKKKLKGIYDRMKISPAEAIGEVTSQSIGEPCTQMMMETIHAAGRLEAKAIKTVLGLPRLIEIFDARREPETPTMKIYLKEKYREDRKKVEEITSKLEETKLENLAKKITLNLSELALEIELNEEKLESKDISYEELKEKIGKRKKIEIEREGDLLKVRPEESSSVKKLYDLKPDLREKKIGGIEGIERAVAKKKDGEYVIKTEGSNLSEVLKMKEVNPVKTRSNDIWEIYRVLGIEAARRAIIDEAVDTIDEQGQEVDIRHIMLVADAMTSQGTIRGTTRYGLAGNKESVLARASFEVPLEHLKKASMKGEVDELRGPVENLMIGQIPPVGTGMIELALKESGSE